MNNTFILMTSIIISFKYIQYRKDILCKLLLKSPITTTTTQVNLWSIIKKPKKTDTGYAYDPMEDEIYQLTNDMTIVDHKNTGFD